MAFEFLDHSQKTLEEVDAAIERALMACGLAMEAHAKINLDDHIDTGRLRGSVTFATIHAQGHSDPQAPVEPKDYQKHGKPDAHTVVIGTNVEYAPFLEDGTSKIAAVHFLKRAIAEHVDEYKNIIKINLGT